MPCAASVSTSKPGRPRNRVRGSILRSHVDRWGREREVQMRSQRYLAGDSAQAGVDAAEMRARHLSGGAQELAVRHVHHVLVVARLEVDVGLLVEVFLDDARQLVRGAEGAPSAQSVKSGASSLSFAKRSGRRSSAAPSSVKATWWVEGSTASM